MAYIANILDILSLGLCAIYKNEHIRFDDRIKTWKAPQLPQQMWSTASHMNQTKILVQVKAVMHLAFAVPLPSLKH